MSAADHAQTVYEVQLANGTTFAFPAKVWADEIVMRRLFALEGVELPATADDGHEGDWLDFVFALADAAEAVAS